MLQEITVLKLEIPVPKNLTVSVEFGGSAFPQYLVYFELRSTHPNYALWIVTTHFVEDFTQIHAASVTEFATQVREIVQNENEPQEY